MTTTRPYSTEFKLGVNTLNGGSGTHEIDPYARRAIDVVAYLFGRNLWLPPQDAVDVAVIGDIVDWEDQVALVILRRPFDARRNDARAVPLDELLRREGHTALMQRTHGEIDELSPGRTARAILNEGAIFDFLFAYAYYEHGFRDAEPIACWMVDTDLDDGGVGVVYRAVAEFSFLDYVDRERIEVDVPNNPNLFVQSVQAETATTYQQFDTGAFEAYLAGFVRDFVFRRQPLAQIRRVTGNLGLNATPAEVEYLANYFEAANITLDDATANALVPAVLTTHRSSSMSSLLAPSEQPGPIDFGVSYHTDSNASTSVNASNVRCAAQLFYVMTLGDELGVFRATDLLITRYMGVGRVDVKSAQLMRDLQDYAFNDEFREVVSGRINQRTSEEERRMFYRQVFDMGDTELLDGMATNTDFASLWNALMVETVRYIEKVEQAENPASFVSRSSLQQVMEDLQYNLSTYSSGMAKVMTPIAYKEFDFLIERIWKSQEIIDQLAIHNTGSYLRAIERVLKDDDRRGSNITALLKKAEYGHRILTAVADFTPQMIADDAQVSGLVSLIEAFIIVSEQAGYERSDERSPESQLVTPGGMPDMTMPADEWSF